MHLFHYHLVTSRVREVEARYIGKLGFDLVARHGRIGEDLRSFEPGVSWSELDALGFKLRLTELELGSVNVVVQPGQWPLPRVDHLGLALDDRVGGGERDPGGLVGAGLLVQGVESRPLPRRTSRPRAPAGPAGRRG